MQIISGLKIYTAALVVAFVLTLGSYGQTVEPEIIFRAPLNIELFLAGNFGEVRSNHFHSGIDIKTGGQTGQPVLATAEGYISRIKVQAGGYGHALYMKHPNGYTSVYGHLKEFDKELKDYLREQQYRLKSFEVDLFPKAGTFNFKQGDIIGLSGNSGSSQGPHLHFELRETQTENPVNPLLYSFEIIDNRAPVIYSINLYNLDGRKGLKKPDKYKVSGSEGKYFINEAQPINADKTFGIGIETIDFLNGSSNKCGVFSIKMFVDNELYFNSEISEFSFAESRYINSFIDYAEYFDNRSSLYKTFIEPNNNLSILQFAKNKGIIEFTDTEIHHIKLETRDVAGNLSELEFKVIQDTSRRVKETDQTPLYSSFFHYAENNIYEDENITLIFPAKALYDNLYFSYESADAPAGAYSRLHRIHKPSVPLHKSFTIKLEPDSLPLALKENALIARINENGESSIGGKWENGYLVSSTRSFGDYTIMVDTIPPEIKPRNFKTGHDLIGADEVRFTISDEFSGISSYKGEIDGEWVLFEWDPKNRLLFHDLRYRPLDKSKAHVLSLIVIDGAGNTQNFSVEIK